jgi:hypothetical protein
MVDGTGLRRRRGDVREWRDLRTATLRAPATTGHRGPRTPPPAAPVCAAVTAVESDSELRPPAHRAPERPRPAPPAPPPRATRAPTPVSGVGGGSPQVGSGGPASRALSHSLSQSLSVSLSHPETPTPPAGQLDAPRRSSQRARRLMAAPPRGRRRRRRLVSTRVKHRTGYSGTPPRSRRVGS